MNIKKSIEYGQVALFEMIKGLDIPNKRKILEQLGESMWLSYYLYDDTEITENVTRILKDLELKTWLNF